MIRVRDTVDGKICNFSGSVCTVLINYRDSPLIYIGYIQGFINSFGRPHFILIDVLSEVYTFSRLRRLTTSMLIALALRSHVTQFLSNLWI